jgi:Flp pilus assembly pilin Flp
MLRRFVSDESHAFLIEAGLIVTLIASVIALRVIQFSLGA